MKLYHGTSSQHLASILRSGLKPRGKKKGNWEHTVESCPDAVYLTSAYAHHFALSACKRKQDRCLIVEVDTELLDPFYLLPDEDALAFVNKEGGDSLVDRSAYYRESLLRWAGTEGWNDSINLLGNCCYFGAIPRSAITRMVSFSRHNVLRYSDPTISPMNYRIMGEYYRALVAMTFGDNPGELSDITKVQFQGRTSIELSCLLSHI